MIEPAVTPARHVVNGVTLHAAEAGPESGPLVILLHGFPEFWWGWRHQIPALAEAGLRVCAPDQRGYNLSSKPPGARSYDLDTLAADVIGLADAHKRERVRIVGHDWGGLVAWWVAGRHPERIERLAILNAPHPSVVGSYARRHLSQALKSSYVGFFQLPFLPEAMLGARDYRAMRRALTRSSRPGTFDEADLARYAQTWAEPGALTAMLNWYRALRHRPSAQLRIACETLVLWGRRDEFLERGLALRSLDLCDRGRIVDFPDATHWLHLEEPEQVNAELVGFLAE